MANNYFQFKQFTVQQDRCAMKVTTDGCLFGAWVAEKIGSNNPIAIGSAIRSILDIGAGTGLLSLMVAQKINGNITAIEIDKDALEQALQNIASSPWNKNIKAFHADVKELAFPSLYDLIVSNPPFYENEWQSGNSKRNTAHHNSELLLEDLLDIISAALKPNGKFYLLLPYKRHEEIKQIFNQKKITITKKMLVRQSENHDYFRIMIEADFGKSADTVTDEIAIRNKKNEYTEEFTELLKDYYLYI